MGNSDGRQHETRVLLVEDESLVRRAVARLLQSRGMTVVTAEDGQEGYDRLQSGEVEFDVVLCDVNMPRLSGCQFHEAATRAGLLGPDGPEWLQMTGGLMSTADALYLRKATYPVLDKPMEPEELLKAVTAAAQRRNARRR